MGLRTLHSLNFQICSILNHSKQKKAYISRYIVDSLVSFVLKVPFQLNVISILHSSSELCQISEELLFALILLDEQRLYI